MVKILLSCKSGSLLGKELKVKEKYSNLNKKNK
jgi:hypothetical protein